MRVYLVGELQASFAGGACFAMESDMSHTPISD